MRLEERFRGKIPKGYAREQGEQAQKALVTSLAASGPALAIRLPASGSNLQAYGSPATNALGQGGKLSCEGRTYSSGEAE